MITSDAITWTAPNDDHPARAASQRSYSAVAKGDLAEWLTVYAEDAVLEDPVGPSFFDPDGVGHHGRAGAEHFWDVAIAPVDRFDVEVRRSYATGDSSAQEATFTATFADGSSAAVDLIVVYRVDADGLITSMRAYWEL